MKKTKVLLIEDDEIDREKVDRLLGESFELFWVETGKDGIIFNREKEMDLILLDFRLPGGTGLDFLPPLRADRPSIPIIFLTGGGSEETAVEALKAGANDYLSKGKLTSDSLLRSIKNALERTDLQQKIQKQQHEIEETKRFLEAIFENMPNMVFVKEANDLRFILLNGAGEKLFGLSRKEVIGKNDYDFFPKAEADFFTRTDRNVLNGQSVVTVPEEPIQTPGFGRRWLRTQKVPINGPDGRPKFLLGISEDITEMKAVREKLESQTRELEIINRELEQFAYVASHDLKEPLRVVTNFSEMLKEEYGQGQSLDDQAIQYLDYIVDAAKRQRALIDNILEYSRVGSHGAQLKHCSLEEVLTAVKANLRVSIQEAGLDLDFNDLPPVLGNREQLIRLFQNLIANSIKFKRSEVKPKIQISCRKSNGRLEFCLKDNGIGFEKEFEERIFGIFERLHSRDEYPGSGIGLSICRKIVELHHGKIWAKGEPNNGSSFFFTLRSVEAADQRKSSRLFVKDCRWLHLSVAGHSGDLKLATLSSEGCGFYSRAPVLSLTPSFGATSRAAQVKLQLSIEGDSRPLTLEGRVVDITQSAKEGFYYSVNFVSSDLKDYESILERVESDPQLVSVANGAQYS